MSRTLSHDITDFMIAELDGKGRIVSVNGAWKRFAARGGVSGSFSAAVGDDYQALLQLEGGPKQENSDSEYALVSRVLSGERDEFVLQQSQHVAGKNMTVVIKGEAADKPDGGMLLTRMVREETGDKEPAGAGQENAAQEMLMFERVKQVLDVNKQLWAEVEQRRRAERELRELNEELDKRVKERTDALRITNERLFREVEEREAAEEKVRRSEEFIKAVLDAVPDPLYVADTEHRILQVNQAFCDFFQKSSKELLSRKGFDFLPNEEAASWREKADSVLAEGNSRLDEEQHISKDGKRYVLSTKRAAFSEPRTKETILTAGIRNITENKLAEEALRMAEKSFRDIVENAPLGIFRVDQENGFIMVNGTMAELMGYNSVMAMMNDGDTASEDYLFSAEDWRRLYAVTASGKPVVDYETELRRKDGGIVRASVNMREVRDAKGRCEYHEGFIVDISRRKQAEDELRKAHDSLEMQVQQRTEELKKANAELIKEVQVRKRAEHESAEAKALLDAAFEQTPVGIIVVDAKEEAFRLINSEALSILGRDRQAFPTTLDAHVRNLELFYPDGGRVGMDEGPLYRAVHKAETSSDVEFIMPVGPSESRWLLVNAGPVCNAQGDVVAGVSVFQDITDRKRTEEMITHAKNEWERTFDAISDLIIILDRERRIIRLNMAMSEKLDLTPRDAVGAFLDDVLSSDTDREFFTPTPDTGEKMYGPQMEIERQAFGGWYLVGDAPIRDSEGRVYGTVFSARDITKRKRIEAALNLAHRKYRNIFEKAVEGIFQLSPQGNIVSANPALAEILGYDSPEEMLLMVHDVADQAFVDPHRYAEFVEQIQEYGEIKRFEAKMFKKNGEVIWTVINARALREDSGEVLALEGFLNDVTVRKEAEKQLRTALTELDLIFHSTGDGMCVVDLNLRVLRINKPLLKMFEISEDGIEHLDCHTLFQHEFCDTELCPVQRIMKGEIFSEFDFVRIDAHGNRRSYILTAAPYRDVDGHLNGVLLNVKDITERVMAEEEAKANEQQLIQADKMASLGILVAGVAHEINNPNGIISLNAPMLDKYWNGVLEFIREHHPNMEDIKIAGLPYEKLSVRIPHLIDQIIQGSRRIKGIVGELKDFARKDVQDAYTDVDVNKLVETSISLVSVKIRKTTKHFSVEYYPQELWTRGNFQKLEQVLVNALINACEALTGPKEAITVTVSPDRESESAVVRIQDEGVGIKEKDLKHLFDPFYTTKRDRGGTGLGLSVSHRIIEEHGGSMSFESEVGKGTVCSVTLPIKKLS